MNHSIGEYLKQKRQAKGISLEYICAQTKINYNILKNIEADNFDELPNITYVKGFVQSYLKMIHTDSKEAIEILNLCYQNKKNNSSNENLSHSEQSNKITPLQNLSKSPIKAKSNVLFEKKIDDKLVDLIDQIIANKRIILTGLLSVGIVGAAWYGYSYINQRVSDKVHHKLQQVAQPTNLDQNLAETNDVKTKEENLFESAKLSEMRQEVLKQEPIKTENKTETKPVTKIAKSDKFPFHEFRKLGAVRLYEVKTDASENNDPDLMDKSIKEKMIEGKQNVYIKALFDKTWISYAIDDTEPIAVVLKQGQDLLLQGSKVLIFMGNVNATKVFYNNQLIDPMSKTGVKSLIFPESLIQGQHLPLFKANTDGILFNAKDYIERMSEKENES